MGPGVTCRFSAVQPLLLTVRPGLLTLRWQARSCWRGRRPAGAARSRSRVDVRGHAALTDIVGIGPIRPRTAAPEPTTPGARRSPSRQPPPAAAPAAAPGPSPPRSHTAAGVTSPPTRAAVPTARRSAVMRNWSSSSPRSSRPPRPRCASPSAGRSRISRPSIQPPRRRMDTGSHSRQC